MANKKQYRAVIRAQQKTEKNPLIEIFGNNDGNYVKIQKIAEGDNRMFLEIGDCCVVTFRGILTAEMLSNFLTNVSLKSNKPLIDVIKENMTWEKSVNEKFCVGAKTISWFDTIP